MYEKQIDRVLDALAQVSPAFTEAYVQSMFWAGVNDVAFGAI